MSALPPRPRFDRDEYVSRRALHVEGVLDTLDHLRALHLRFDCVAMRLDTEIAEAQDAPGEADAAALLRNRRRHEAALDKLETGQTLMERKATELLQDMADRFQIRTAEDRALFNRVRRLLIEANEETR